MHLGDTDDALQPRPLGERFRALTLAELAGVPFVEHARGGIDLSPDGTEVVFAWDRSGSHEIYVAPIFGERIYQLTDSGERNVQPRWSPDGRRVAFLRDAGGDLRFAIWLVDRDGKRERVLVAADGATHRDIAWSPDGSRLAFATDRGGPGASAIDVIDIASGARIALTQGGGDALTPRWSPDGSQIAFARRDGTNAELHVVLATGGTATRLETRDGAAGESLDPRWSPDGRSIAFTTDRRGHDEIALAHLDGTTVRRVEVLTNTVSDSTDPVWRPDARAVRYLSSRDASVSVREVFVSSHADAPVADLPGVHRHVAVTPNSATTVFAFSSARRPWDVWVRSPRTVMPQPVTDSLAGRFDHEILVEPVQVRYRSKDGREIAALLYVPHAESTAGSPPPVVVRLPHGDPTRGWDVVAQWFAHRGHVVLVPGARTAAEVIAGLDWLEQKEIADGGRVGVYGLALVTAVLAAEPDRFAAGVTFGPSSAATRAPLLVLDHGVTHTRDGRVDTLRRASEWFEEHLARP